jgi:hypothetical protein
MLVTSMPPYSCVVVPNFMRCMIWWTTTHKVVKKILITKMVEEVGRHKKKWGILSLAYGRGGRGGDEEIREIKDGSN